VATNTADKISVFIVDDSALVRSALSIILGKVPEIEVLGVASNPKIALMKIKNRWPDVIISDIEMPEMNGLEFLDYLNKNHPTPFIVCSSYAGVGAQNSIDALALGAVDIISKPGLGVESFLEEMTGTIVESIKAAASCRIQPRSVAVKSRIIATPTPAPRRHNHLLEARSLSVIAMGSSTGGTTVIEHLLRRLSPQCPPLLIVQHMPMYFTDAFAKRLNAICQITVKEAEDGDLLQGGVAYIAPGGKHMEMVRSSRGYALRVFDGPLVNRHKPSVDTLFDSVADLSARSALGIILTGMGKDGSQGLLRMQQKGALTLAQDEASSVVYGMPKAALDIGATNISLSIAEIASYLENCSVSTE
jgi:two-component system chemotaxis response regulator CheB